ncbi:bifunctional heptose 7-phosphate kinase/heptose 1-phosphate adenyltransferase [Dinghuibacter silviterrae]|uniref:RfaE bifunctional protein kinase chain/domain n=1 Tax=Dinghuibacter silviterrae TaxID=1539049 RepID=A0A4R8DEL4_9BACT|nr:bifunctional ADP-heptose synthase [Dinghuibacter silviterrae]TDW95875.1 rfaE bifunctional protein kinase chain/domain [Dinghuibacter silviterrae]
MQFEELFDRFKNIKVGVLGDLMLDTYMWGRVERISPEAPVPVVALNKKDYRIGGAGNVALNLRALGASVSTLSVIGADDDGRVLRELLLDAGIDTSYLLDTASRITTNKTRIISRNQQMMRLDNEMTSDLAVEDAMLLEAHVLRYLDEVKPDILIFEDYNKGVLTEAIIATVVRLCRERGILTAVDPKRKNFFSYRNVDIFKPNLKEVREGLNLIGEDATLPWLQGVHEQLHAQLKHRISFITLSEKGVFYQSPDASGMISSHVRNIADVSGAGDTVIAVASLVYAATGDVALMAAVANIAGGLVCEEVGTAAIRRERLLEECKVLL